jgi:hypothetical protein
MNKVDRSEILDLGEYEKIRTHFRNRMIARKKNRRISVGEHMTFVFENHDTVLLQIQEMLRTERISAEKGILHELETYNELVPGEGELSATLLIEYDEQAERREALDAMADLGEHVALEVGGAKHPARFRPLPGEEPGRLPAVNYLFFAPGADVAEALRDSSVEARLVVSHPSYQQATALSDALRAELADDLAS